MYNVKGDEVFSALGRADILCKVDQTPFFIIELKAETEDLTEADKKQGISYARLCEPIAPYVILTNGKEIKIYDTITSQKITDTKGEIKSNRVEIALEEELSLRFEALSNFIDFSYSNLLVFCKAFNHTILKKHLPHENSSVEKSFNAKYIPETYVEREILNHKFFEFLEQYDKKIFPVIGESGVGKTSFICKMVEDLDDAPSIFYSGTFLSGSFFESLASDFNLFFSPQNNNVSILKKISSLAKKYSKDVVIFLDAVDEWEDDHSNQQLEQLAKILVSFNIKLVVSCKPLIWEKFLSIKSMPTTISEIIFPDIPLLTDFNNKELNEAIHKYCSYASLTIPQDTSNFDLNNPFFLKVATEVAFIENTSLSSSNKSRAMLQKFLELKLQKSKIPELLERFLFAISEKLLEVDKTQIIESDLRSYLGLDIYSEIPAKLFGFNILYKYTERLNKIHLGFYFSTLRDHIVSTLLLNLDFLRGNERINLIKSHLKNSIFISALAYFFKSGNDSEQVDCLKAILQFDADQKTSNLVKFLSWYGSAISLETYAEIAPHVLDNLKTTFSENSSSSTIAEQVLDAFEKIESEASQGFLVDLFSILCEKSTSPFIRVSHRICNLLKKTYVQTPENDRLTDNLLELVLDQSVDGFVRRSIAVALEHRLGENKREIFLKLANDSDLNVRSYLSGWYKSLEDNKLRDEILDLFDSSDSLSMKDSALLFLRQSKLSDTPKLILDRLVNNSYSDYTTSWMYRALGILNYTDSIPVLLEKLEACLDTKVGENIILSLGDMKSPLILPALLKISELCQTEESLYWAAHSVKDLVDDNNYPQMLELATKANNEKVKYVALNALAEFPQKGHFELLTNYIVDENFEPRMRMHVLRTWSDTLMGLRKTEMGYKAVKIENRIPLDEMYATKIFEAFLKNEKKMMFSFFSLIVFYDTSIERSVNTIKLFDPGSEWFAHGIVFHGLDVEKGSKIALQINPWLSQKLRNELLIEGYLWYIIYLVAVFGNLDTLEALRANLERLNVDKDVYDKIEHTVQKNPNIARTGFSM